MTSISEQIKHLLSGNSLDVDQAEQLCDTIFTGEVPDVQIAAMLTAIEAKTVSASEVAGFAASLRKHAVPVKTNCKWLVDTCGTGGGSVKMLNISTASAIIAAGAGVKIAKHGNRGITSGCGSADVLEALGVNISPGPELVRKSIEQAGIGFMFAPNFHPAMKFVQPIRKALGFRTIFNILGPLANPARANAQVLGVAQPHLMELVVESLRLMGSDYAMVVHSEGMDEISTADITKVAQLKEDQINYFEIDPATLGFAKADFGQLKALDAKSSAEKIKNIITGKDSGPAKDIVVLNVAAAIIAGKIADNFSDGIKIANESIKTGKAKAALEELVKISNQ